jgi:hypothetical protein
MELNTNKVKDVSLGLLSTDQVHNKKSLINKTRKKKV